MRTSQKNTGSPGFSCCCPKGNADFWDWVGIWVDEASSPQLLANTEPLSHLQVPLVLGMREVWSSASWRTLWKTLAGKRVPISTWKLFWG